MTCAYSPEAYVFGSKENHDLLEAETNELLHFGHHFPAPQGGSYWLDDTGKPDLTQSMLTSIPSASFMANLARPNSSTRRSPACVARCTMTNTAVGIRPSPPTAPLTKQARSATPTPS